MNEIKKDLTTVTDGIVAHGCNCAGGFGSGIAGAIKNKWPAVAQDLIVANCYTQEFYGPGDRRYADPDAIEACLYQLLEIAMEAELDLYIAKIGCGLGGLSWEHEVKEIYESVFTDAGINVFVCDI